MAEDDKELSLRPFMSFNFKIEITVPGLKDGSSSVCSAAFAECSGLELTMTPKTIREGGNNRQQIHLVEPITYGQLTLRRGMTGNLDLWKWFDMTMQMNKERTRGSGEVVMLGNDHETVQAQFTLSGCLPTKLRAPALNAATGGIAIEEMQLVYETLTIRGASA